MKRLLAALFAFAAVAGALADPALPEWWPEEIPTSPPTPSPENYRPANLGQLKHMATLAKAHLDATLAGGAGFYVEQMVASFEPDDGVAFTQAEKDANYRPVNLGQLKAVAQPFYDRLKAAGYDVKGNLSARLNPVTAWPFDVPWNPSTPKSENYAPANIGQLKFVFAFDLTHFDEDHDGMSDAWETAQFGNLVQDGAADFDGDGAVNQSEFLYGGNPKVADSDYDGRSDAEELMEGTNPADASDAAQVRLGHFAMSDSALLSGSGKAPKASATNILVPGRKGNGLSVPLTPFTKLNYNHTEADGTSNINLQKGSIRFWIKPNWTTGTSGGPGSWARILECGTYSGAADKGWWGMYFAPDGASIWLVSQDTVGHTGHYLVGTIDWQAGNWYQVVVTYDSTASALYVDGVKVTSGLLPEGLGVLYVPPPAERAGGFSIGADISGGQRTNATIDEVETFNYRLSADKIAADYAADVALGLDANGNGLPDAWDATNFAGITEKTGAQDDYDGDGLTNYQEWQRGTNPKEADTDYDGRSDAMEVADGTIPTDFASAKQVQLASWTFETANLATENGRLPLATSTPIAALRTGGFGGQGLNTTGKAPAQGGSATSFTRYRNAETGGMPNINYKRGTVRLWIKPSWTSSAPGTTTGGPGTSAAILECGIWSNPPSIGFWALAIDGTGNNLIFATQDDAGHGMNNLGHPISWIAGHWYQVTLVYSPTGSKLYVNGTTTTPSTGSGVTYLPPPPIRAQGFLLGTDRNGNQRSDAVIDEVETFNYELTAAQIQADYAKRNSLGIDSDNDGLSDAWEILKFNDLDETANSDPDHDGWTNLDEWLKNMNPMVADRSPGSFSVRPSDIGVSENPLGGREVFWTPTSSGNVAIQSSTDGKTWTTVGFATGSSGTFTDPDVNPDVPTVYRVGSESAWSALAASDPFGDFDGDGLSNQEEASNGTDPGSTDSDKDGVLDGVDGWAHASKLSPPRLGATSYAVIEISKERADNAWINNKGQAVVMKTEGPLDDRTSTASYWAGGIPILLADNFFVVGISDDAVVAGNTKKPHKGDQDLGSENPLLWIVDTCSNNAAIWRPGGKIFQAARFWGDIDITPYPPDPAYYYWRHTENLNDTRNIANVTSNSRFYGQIGASHDRAFDFAYPTGNGSEGKGYSCYTELAADLMKTGTPSYEMKSTSYQKKSGAYGASPEVDIKNSWAWPEPGSGLIPVLFNDSDILVGTHEHWRWKAGEKGDEVETYDVQSALKEGTSIKYLKDIGGAEESRFDAISDGTKPWILGHAEGFGDTALAIWTKTGAWENATPESHGFSGTAKAVNKRGEIVGEFTDSEGKTGQLIRDQKLINLNEVVSGWQIQRITDINESGTMVGSAKDAEQKEHAVMLVPIEISFEPVGDNVPIEDNGYWDWAGIPYPQKFVWMPGKGKKIYPDAKDPNDNKPRNHVYVKVKTGLPRGTQVSLRVFDVDDPSSDETIDPNGDVGKDNLELEGDSALPIPVSPHFEGGGDTIQCTTDDHGIAKVGDKLPELVVTRQPGDNFRVAVSVGTQGGGDVSGLQVDDKNLPKYVPSGDSQVSGFNGVVSPMLTTWRKLHIQIDSMEEMPESGSEKNYEEGNVLSVVSNSSSESTITVDNLLTGPQNRYEFGYVTIDGVSYEIKSNTDYYTNLISGDNVVVKGSVPSSVVGKSYTIVDDDDKFLNEVGISKPFTDNALGGKIISNIFPVFCPAYIHVEDAQVEMFIPFKLNAGTSVAGWGWYNFNSLDKAPYWAHIVTLAYQPAEAEDRDPNSENPSFGETPEFPGLQLPFGFSALFLESFRELAIPGGTTESMLLSPIVREERRESYYNTLFGTIAHEIAHAPGNQTEGADHSELYLMEEGSHSILERFGPKTIIRMRKAGSWRN